MATSVADNELWHVLLASDDMKRMNVDQLDDAFRLSLIDGSTLVWKDGMERWRRLGSVADLEEELESLEDFEELEEVNEVEVVEGFETFDPGEEPTRVLDRVPIAYASLSPYAEAAWRQRPRWPSPPAAKSALPGALAVSAPAPAPRVSAETRAAAAAAFEAAMVRQPVTRPQPVAQWQPVARPQPVTQWQPVARPQPVTQWQPVAHPQPVTQWQPVARPQSVTQWQPQQAPLRAPVAVAPVRWDLPSEVDFRPASTGVRWRRWLLAVVLAMGAIVVGYRQNWLRAGARSLGVEDAYLASERSTTAMVEASAPASVKAALTWLALLPGPNALPSASPALAPVPVPVQKTLAPEHPAPVTASPSDDPAPASTAEPAREPQALSETAAEPEQQDQHVARSRADTTPAPVANRSAKAAVKPKATTTPRATSKPKAKTAAQSKPAPKPHVARRANESALDAAIRMAVVNDAKKK